MSYNINDNRKIKILFLKTLLYVYDYTLRNEKKIRIF